jgi:hypothetical protein
MAWWAIDMGGVAIGFLAAGTAVSAFSQHKAGRANSRIAKQNAAIGRIQAADTLERAEDDVDIVREQREIIRGEQIAAFAGQGVDLSSDVVSRIETNTDMVIESEIATVRNNAARAAWGLEVGAQQTEAQGRLARRAGTSAAIGTLLGGAASISLTGAQIKSGAISA